MSIVNTLKNLKSNLFGGPGNTGFSKPPPSKVQNIGMTPTATVDSDPLQFGTYQFPKDVFENQQLGHYMVFYVNVQDRSKFNYDGKFIPAYDFDEPTGLQSKSARVKWQKQKKGLRTGTNSGNGEPDLKDSSRNSAALQGLGARRKTTTRIKDSIALYLPPNVVDTTSATYEDTPTGILGFGANTILDLVNAGQIKDYELMGKLTAEGAGIFSKEALKRLGGALAESLAGAEGAIPLANRIFGSADNPFVEVFFNTMNVRTFTYNFNLAPRNEAETMEIQQIIQLFRFHMAPELQGTNSRYYTLPSEFDIHYMYKAEDGNGYENDYFNRIGTCVLENVSTNYTPNGVKSFADGAPTQITMSLTFRETEVLTKTKINEGF